MHLDKFYLPFRYESNSIYRDSTSRKPSKTKPSSILQPLVALAKCLARFGMAIVQLIAKKGRSFEAQTLSYGALLLCVATRLGTYFENAGNGTKAIARFFEPKGAEERGNRG